MAQSHVDTHAGMAAGSDVPEIRRITTGDVADCVRRGFADFREQPSHYALVALIYPVIMIVVAFWVSGQNVLPLIYPVASGLALLGPIVALVFYEISRRRELGLDTSWRHGIEALNVHTMPSILGLGLMLLAIFVVWLAVAQGIYTALFGEEVPASLLALAGMVFTTPQGWMLIVVGNLVGFVFAAFVLCATVVAFPLLLERRGTVGTAIETSFRVALANPVAVAFWGLTIAVLLAIAVIPAFLGTLIVIPALGHATWHFYRKAVAPRGA